MEAFATTDDLRLRWRELTDEEAKVAGERLLDATAYITSQLSKYRVPLLDEGDDGYEVQRRNLKAVTCNVVRRSMSSTGSALGDSAGAPVSMETVTAGVFSQTYQYSNPLGDLYLTKAEKESLGIGRLLVSTVRASMTDREAVADGA